MANDNKYIPALRFPEFQNDGEWEIDTMENIFDIKNGYTPSKSNPAFWDNGTIPWFRMEDIRKNGHILSDSIQHITPIAVKNAGLFPAYSIIVATTATIGEHALIIVDSLANQRFTFLTKRKSFDNKLDMMYFHYFMFIVDEWCKRNTNAGGLLSVNMDSFKKLTIPYPSSILEQKKIADCFISIDKEIDATKRKLEQLKEYKKGLMQRLFPSKGKTIPELRFPEFQNGGEWRTMLLGEITSVVNRRNKSNRSLPIYSINNTDGFIPQSQQFIGIDSEARGYDISVYKIIGKHTFAYNPARINVGSIGYSGELKDILISSLYVCFKTADDVDDNFLMCFFNSYIFNQAVESSVEGGIRSYLFYENFSRISIAIPSLYEQKRIASCITSIEDMIKNANEQINLLEKHKKGLLQQLFPTIK